MSDHPKFEKFPDKATWLMVQPHQHVMLDPVRASLESQLFLKEEKVEDSKAVEFARKRIEEEGESVETLKYLCEKLNLQLRYRETIVNLEKAHALEPENSEVMTLLAGRYLTTCQTEKALDMYLKSFDLVEDKMGHYYRIGLSYFYMSQYKKAREYFVKGLSYCDELPDMHVAFVYWILFCYVELGEDIAPAMDMYKELFVVHHAGYEYAIRLFLGDKPEEFEKNSMHDNLTRIMYLFGKAEYYKWKQDFKMYETVFKEALECNEYWASYSGIAVWSMYIRGKLNKAE